MKKLFLCMVFVLTGCALFRTNEGLVRVNEKYPYPEVEAIVPNNCFRLLYYKIKEYDYHYYDYLGTELMKTHLKYDTGLGHDGILGVHTEMPIVSKLLAACEACEVEYPKKSKEYKDIISEIKSDIQKHEENERKKQEAQEKAEQEVKKSIEKARQERENMSKQYGYPWCNPRYLFFTQNKCMDEVNGAFFQVLQQTPDGTLVSFIKSPDYVLLISKNSKDDSVADGYSIYNGIFAVDGTYQYTSVFGATRTVKRLKRLK